MGDTIVNGTGLQHTLELINNRYALKNHNHKNIGAGLTTLKSPYSLSATVNGTKQFTYNGESEAKLELTASKLGAAASNHTHSGLSKAYTWLFDISRTTPSSDPWDWDGGNGYTRNNGRTMGDAVTYDISSYNELLIYFQGPPDCSRSVDMSSLGLGTQTIQYRKARGDNINISVLKNNTPFRKICHLDGDAQHDYLGMALQINYSSSGNSTFRMQFFQHWLYDKNGNWMGGKNYMISVYGR